MSQGGFQKKAELPTSKDKMLLISSLLDITSKVKSEAQQKKAKKKKLVTLDVKIEAQSEESDVNMRQKFSDRTEKEVSAIRDRWRRLIGQTLSKSNSSTPSEEAATVTAEEEMEEEEEADDEQLYNKTSFALIRQLDWEFAVKWGDFGKPLQIVAPAAMTNTEPDEIQMEWDEELPSTHHAIVAPTEVKKIKTSWDLPKEPSKGTSLDSTTVKSLKKWNKDTPLIARNNKLVKDDWLQNIIWNDEPRPSLVYSRDYVPYHHFDDAFIIEETNRRKRVREKLQQQQKALQQQAAEQAVATAATSSAEQNASKIVTNEALRGTIQEAPTLKKNQPGRGPPKKELNHRRYTQFGELLRVLGILEDDDGVPIPQATPRVAPPPPPVPTATTEKEADVIEKSPEPSSMGWKSLIPIIRHSEPASELEWFDPQLRYLDPVRNYRRPLTHHREGQRVKLVVDPAQFDQARNPAGVGGVRVDSAGITPVAGNVGDRISRKSDLSAKNGKICLFEYTEQHPLIVNGAGMSSNLVNFYRQEKGGAGDVPPKPEMGLFVGLAPDEISPMMTRIDPGKIYRILQNNMMHVPVFEHRPSSTDFLLIRSKSNSSLVQSTLDPSKLPHEIALIRRINKLFVCGQVEPQFELFQPNESNNARTKFMVWLEKYMEFHFATRLKRRDDLRIQFQFALDMFSLANEKMVERSLSAVAEKEKAGGENKKRWWIPIGTGTISEITELTKTPSELRRELEEKRRMCLTVLKPEDCCSWEQLQLGLAKLAQTGIEKVARAEVPRVQEAFQMIRRLHALRKASHEALMESNKIGRTPFPTDAVKQFAAARFVVQEIQLTPWYLSTCFYWLHLHAERQQSPFPPDTVMRVTGLGDPTGRSEMVSFLPSYRFVQKGVSKQQKASRESEGDDAKDQADDEDEFFYDPSDGKKKMKKARLTPAADDKPKYGGTANDLRIVKMERLGEILIELGIPAEEVAKISRWDRTWLIEKAASSKIGHTLLGGGIAKYARIPTSLPLEGAPATTEENAPSQDSSRDEAIARKKLEESQVFSEHRDRVTRVYQRMSQALTAETQKVAAPVLTSSTQKSIEDDDDDLREFAGNLELGLLSDKQEDSVMKAKEEEDNVKKTQELLAPRVGWTPFSVLKRTIIEVLPNGTENIRVEYHKNPEAVRQFEQAQKEKAALKQQQVTKMQTKEHSRTGGGGGPGAGIPRTKKSNGSSNAAPPNVTISVGSSSAKIISDREKAKADEKDWQTKELQKQHAEWYKSYVERYGKDFAKDFKEDDPRLPSTMPRRGRSKPNKAPSNLPILRCTICGLPGHNQQSPLCPLHEAGLQANEAIKVEESGMKLKVNMKEIPPTTSSNAVIKKKEPPISIRTSSAPRGGVLQQSGPLADLARKFASILDDIEKTSEAEMFLLPVNKKSFPTYPKLIRRPMDLSKMRGKLENGSYKKRGDFIADLQLMHENSNIFNGPNDAISANARFLIKMVKEQLDPQTVEYEQLEMLVASKSKSSFPTNTSGGVSQQATLEEGEEEIVVEEGEEVVEEGEVIVEEEGEIVVEEEGEVMMDEE